MQKDESMSIEGQRMINKSFCNFNDIEIVSDYVDDGYSGANFDRPGFQKMINDIENGTINCVVTKDFSRLGRELYETGKYIEDYFSEKNIRYIAINDKYDSSKGEDTMISMKLTFNDYFLRDTSRKVKTSLRARMENGLYIGNIPKYGYIKDPEDHHHLLVDPVASIVVKRIFDMAVHGNSTRKIAHTLTTEKIPIPVVHKKDPRCIYVTENDGYGIWKHQTIRDILSSKMYLGHMEQHLSEKVRYNSKKLRKIEFDDHIVVENTHEPLVDKEIFDKVQLLLKSSYRLFKRNSEDKALFHGLLYCKDCGHRLTILPPKNKKNDYRYTVCNLYNKKGKYGICSPHRINYTILEKDLINELKKICNEFINEYDSESLTNEASVIFQEDINKIQNNINKLSFEINKYNKAIEELYLDKVKNNLRKDIFDNLLSNYNSKIKIATEEKESLESHKIELTVKINQIDYKNCSKYVKEFLESEKINRDLVALLVSKVEVDEQKKINLVFSFPELTCYVR